MAPFRGRIDLRSFAGLLRVVVGPHFKSVPVFRVRFCVIFFCVWLFGPWPLFLVLVLPAAFSRHHYCITNFAGACGESARELSDNSHKHCSPNHRLDVWLGVHKKGQIAFIPKSISQMAFKPKGSGQMALKPKGTGQMALKPKSTGQIAFKTVCTGQLAFKPMGTRQMFFQTKGRWPNGV